MAEDFRAKITAELDTAAAENKLEAFLNKKNKLKVYKKVKIRLMLLWMRQWSVDLFLIHPAVKWRSW